MKLKTFAVFLLFLVPLLIRAQEFRSVEQVDAFTYDLYLKKDWKNLIPSAKAAQKQKFDFYYLRYRLAVAYYETRKYAQAIPVFETLLRETPKDDVLKEYLYFSYFFSGRQSDAEIFSENFSFELKQKLDIRDDSPVKSWNFAIRFDFIPDEIKQESLGADVEQISLKEQNYFGLGIEHKLGKKFLLLHDYSRIASVNTVQVDVLSTLPPVYDESVKQNEYNLALHFLPKTGIRFFFDIHYLNTHLSADNPLMVHARKNPKLYDVFKHSFSGTIGFSKRFSHIQPVILFSASNFNNQKQLQPELDCAIYPFGNFSLRLQSNFKYLINTNADETREMMPVFKQSVGILFWKRVLLEPGISFGKIKNYTDLYGTIANNELDAVRMRAETLLGIYLAKGRFNLFVKFDYAEKENTYSINGIENSIIYHNQSITGGIKWNLH